MRTLALLIALALPQAAFAWAVDGTRLTGAPRSQILPLIASDGSGGAFVGWGDARAGAGEYDVYLQHVTGAGEIAPGWPVDGLLVAGGPEAQAIQGIVGDGEGGALVTWGDQGSDIEGNVGLQRISASGAVAPGWPAGGLLVCSAPGEQVFPKLASDGTGGAFVAWADRRSGLYVTYIQHVLGNGSLAPGWPVDGSPLAPWTLITGIPRLLPDGAGGVLTSVGASNSPANEIVFILVQHLLGSGQVSPGWPAQGVVACTDLPQSRGPSAMVPDGAGGAFLVWDDPRDDPGYQNYDVYAQHVRADGTIPPGWPATGLPLALLPSDQSSSRGCEDAQGGLYAAWGDFRTSITRAYLVRIGPDGQQMPGWPENGLPVSTEPGYQFSINLAPDGLGGAYVAWSTYTGIYKVLVQHFTGAGSLAAGWPPSGLRLAMTAGTQDYPAIVPDGSSGAIITWHDYRSTITFADIYAQRVVNDGIVSAAISLVSAEATPLEVRLLWFAADATSLAATVYRRDEQTDWENLGTIAADGNGQLEFVDRAVIAGTRYAYRVGVASGSSETFSAETWIEVPAALSLALEGMRPNPAVGPLVAAFTLPKSAPATLELLDVGGRRLLARDVGSLGPGRHLIRLDLQAHVPAGLYWLRLTQGREHRLAKAVVIQ